MSQKVFLACGASFAFIAVAAGAFGAHYLKVHISTEMLQVFETGVRYQMYHALALILVAFIVKSQAGRWINTAGWMFVAGIVLFSGSLYALSLTGIKWLGAITPLGCVAFLLGWFCLTVHALKTKGSE